MNENINELNNGIMENEDKNKEKIGDDIIVFSDEEKDEEPKRTRAANRARKKEKRN